MIVRSVIFAIEEVTQVGIQICNSPRLLDRQTGILALQRNKTVHTSIEVSKLNNIFLKAPCNI